MNVFDLAAKITLDATGYEQGLANAKGQADSFGGKVLSGLKTAAKVTGAAITAASGAIVAFGLSSVKAGMDFDKSMSQVAATMGTTVDQIQELRDFAQEMGRTTAFSATQAADALNYMALAGYDAETSMAMLPNVLSLAAAGNFDLARASDMVTDTQTAFGISLERTSQMVDEMAKAASTGNTSVEQLGEAFLVVGGLAKNLNGGFVELSDGTQGTVDGVQELEIALTAMANAGVKGSEAGTHMRNMLMKLASPTAEGTKQMEALGVSVFDADGNMRSLREIMGDLNTSMGQLTQQEKLQAIADLFNARDIASAEALLSAVEQDWDGIGESILNAQGAAQKMAETQLDNLAGDITLFKSALEGAKIAVSDSLSPALREFVQIGTEGISKMAEGFKKGGLEGAFESFGDTLSKLITKVVDVSPKLVDAGIKLVDSLIEGIGKNLPKISTAVTKLATKFINGVVDTLPKIIKLGIQLVLKLAEGIGKALPDLVPAVVKMINEIVINFTKNIGEIVKVGSQIINGLISGIVKGIPELIKATPEIIAALFTGLLDAFTSGIGGLIEGIARSLNIFNNDALDGWYAHKAAIEAYIAAGQEAYDAAVALNDQRVESYGSMEAEIGIIENIKDKLGEYVDEQGYVKEGYEDEVAALETLAEKYGIHWDVVDGQIQEYGTLIETIDAVIQKRKEEAIVAAETSIYEEAYKERRKLDSDYQKHFQNFLDAQAESEKALREGRLEDSRKYSEIANEELVAAKSLKDGIVEYTAQMELANYNMVQATAGNFDDLASTYDQAGIDVEEFYDDIEKTNQKVIKDYEKTYHVDIPQTIEDGNYEAQGILKSQLIAQQYLVEAGLDDIAVASKLGWTEAGEQGIAGLIRAFDEGQSEVINSATHVMASAIAAAKTEAGIKSPSRVFREIGENLTKGLAIGIDKGANEAINAAVAMVDDINSSMDALDGDVDLGFEDSLDGLTIEQDGSQTEYLLSNIADKFNNFEEYMYEAISRALADGFDLRFNDRELTRLVKEHA